MVRTAVNLEEFVGRLAQTFEPMAEQKQVFFRVIKSPDLPATLDTDAQRLSQVLRNLLSNALKFTERGEVALEIAARGEHGNSVRDTGIGIAEEHHQVIFEPFRQADGTTNRSLADRSGAVHIARTGEMLGGNITLKAHPVRAALSACSCRACRQNLRGKAASHCRRSIPRPLRQPAVPAKLCSHAPASADDGPTSAGTAACCW